MFNLFAKIKNVIKQDSLRDIIEMKQIFKMKRIVEIIKHD